MILLPYVLHISDRIDWHHLELSVVFAIKRPHPHIPTYVFTVWWPALDVGTLDSVVGPDKFLASRRVICDSHPWTALLHILSVTASIDAPSATAASAFATSHSLVMSRSPLGPRYARELLERSHCHVRLVVHLDCQLN